jgi:hypothetical protein
MKIELHTKGNSIVGELISTEVEIKEAQDALDIMANASYMGAKALIVYEHQLNPEFFVLRSRFAGEVLQKFSNYRMKLAIVGDFSNRESNSLRDFIFESNRQGSVVFLPTLEEAIDAMLK